LKHQPIVTSNQNYPWSLEMMVRFSDTDAVGHLNNVSMVRYHDNAAMAFLSDVLAVPGSGTMDPRLTIVRQDISFDAETFYPDPLTLCAAVTEIQIEWFVLALAIFQNGRRTGSSTAVVALVDEQQQVLDLPVSWVTRLSHFSLRQQ